MASPFDRLMNTIEPHLPGAIHTAIKQELFLTMHSFFDWSDTWQEKIEFTLQVGSQTADIMPYAGRILRLMHVTRDGMAVRGAMITDITEGTIRMPYEASEPKTYEATISVTVADPVSRDAYPIVPQELVKRYTDTLISGILSKMMAQPSKPYTNLTLAQYHLLKFRGGAARAKNEMKAGHTNGSQAWTFPQTFNRR